MTLHKQPDDPGVCICSKCGSTYRPDPDADALRLLLKNAGHVPELRIAVAAGISLKRLRKIAAEHDIDLRFTPPREPEPRGA